MQNLVLLTETRHSIPSSSSSSSSSCTNTTTATSNYITNVIANPNVDHDDRHFEPTIIDEVFNFILSSNGTITAINSCDSIVWTLDLSATFLDTSSSTTEPEPPTDDDDGCSSSSSKRCRWIHLSYVEATDVLVALSHCGAIVSIDPNNGLGELIGSFDFGIECALWSNDGEVLALVTFQLMEDDDDDDGAASQQEESPHDPQEIGGTEDEPDTPMVANHPLYEPSSPSPLQPPPPPQPKIVPVLTTMNTNYEILSETSLPPHKHNAPITLAWNHKTDKPSLALSTHDSSDDIRRVRIFDGTTLEFESMGRLEDGSGKIIPNLLETGDRGGIGVNGGVGGGMGMMAWAGDATSNVLAVIQKKGRKNRTVVFIEPNGLQHGGCKLAQVRVEEGEEVVGLDWNAESDLLVVILCCTPCSSKKKKKKKKTGGGGGGGEEKVEGEVEEVSPLPYGKVQLYHRCNYHWYIKYELRYHPGFTVSSLSFDPMKAYDLSIALQQNINNSNNTSQQHLQEWRHYQFVWDPSTTSPTTGLATVVDGRFLNCTELERAIVPPPMYGYQLKFDAVVLGVAHLPDSLREVVGVCGGVCMVVHCNDGRLALCGSSKEGGGASSILGYLDLSTTTTTTQDHDWNYNTDDLPPQTEHNGLLDASSLRQLTVIDMKLEGHDTVILDLLAVKCPSSTTTSCSLQEDACHLTACFHLPPIDESSKSLMKGTVTTATDVKLEGRALRIANWSNTSKDINDEDGTPLTGAGGALVELVDGNLFEFTSSSIPYTDCYGEIRISTSVSSVFPCESEPTLLEPCPHISALLLSSHTRLLIGLSPRHRLYSGERLLTDAASSFSLSPNSHNFLSYITLGSRSQLRFLPISVLAKYDPLLGSSDQDLHLIGGEGYEPRSVERGSTMVMTMGNKPTIVVQLYPRGNLEAVYPRALVLPHIMGLVGEGSYKEALAMMRKQRVDTNILVDMDVGRFLEVGVGLLVEQVRDIDHLNLFIACLQNSDITEYKHIVPFWLRKDYGVDRGMDGDGDGGGGDVVPKPNATFDFSTKVNQLCAKIRSTMMEAEKCADNNTKDGYFLLPILSTFAKEDPPQLDKALALIKSNAEAAKPTTISTKSNRKSILLSEKAQSSIQYLAFLADYELLFNTALGMYDFPLSKAVARNSQMDPKVYLPLLKRFINLPPFVAKYEVDIRLKRYESALDHLFQSGQKETQYGVGTYIDETHFETCLLFIEEHKLQRLGLKLFYKNADWHRRVTVSLGEQMLSESKADLALSIFQSTVPRFVDGAKRAARDCGDWRTFFTLLLEGGGDDNDTTSTKMTMDDPEFQEIATEVADEISMGRGGLHTRREGYAAASSILINYCNDVPSAIDMLTTAEMWFEGRRLAVRYRDDDNGDSIERVVDAAVAYGYGCLEDFETRAGKFEVACGKYSICVEARKTTMKEGGDGGGGGIGGGGEQDETGSLFSMASAATNASVRSTMSSSSMGSVGSVTSVISAGAMSNFSLAGDNSMKHKSKFNKIGRGPDGKKKKKKRKPTRREKQRYKAGSEEELKSLVLILKENAIDDVYRSIVVETIQFLAQVNNVSMAKDMYDAYEAARMRVEKSQVDRIELTRTTRENEERTARREGHHFENVTLDCEEEMDLLRCSVLPAVMHDFFSYLVC